METAEKAGKADNKAGSLWMGRQRIAGVGPPPTGVEAATSDHGWLDAKFVADKLGESEEALVVKWQPRPHGDGGLME